MEEITSLIPASSWYSSNKFQPPLTTALKPSCFTGDLNKQAQKSKYNLLRSLMSTCAFRFVLGSHKAPKCVANEQPMERHMSLLPPLLQSKPRRFYEHKPFCLWRCPICKYACLEVCNLRQLGSEHCAEYCPNSLKVYAFSLRCLKFRARF